MHTQNLDPSLLDIRLHGKSARLAELFPRWGASDRLGVIVASPMGAVGAAALIAAAIGRFYEARQERGARAWVYPEIYAFHVGGLFGDLSYFDFLPSRKEVFLPSDEPLAILEALNDRAITHLAVPDAAPATHEFIWQELNVALERIADAFVYGSTGRVGDADVAIGLDPALDELVLGVLRPAQLLIDWDPVATLGTPRAPQGDGRWRRDWLAGVRRRMVETTEDQRAAAERAFEACRHEGRVEQHFRRIDPREALSRIAGIASSRAERLHASAASVD